MAASPCMYVCMKGGQYPISYNSEGSDQIRFDLLRAVTQLFSTVMVLGYTAAK